MRAAICFYGLVGSKLSKNGMGKNLDPAIAFEHYKKHILDKNKNVDIFIHTWSVEAKNKLQDLYKPKTMLAEKQKSFPNSKNHPTEPFLLKTKLKFLIMKFFNNKKLKKWLIENQLASFRAYSRWYSSSKVLKMKQSYEKKNNFKYDVVMLTRLDLCFFSDLDFTKYKMEYFYASHRNDSSTLETNYTANYENHKAGEELQDLWFFSNSHYLDEFGKLYENIEKYHINPHKSSKQHLDTFLEEGKIKYTLYRWFDYELVRRKFFNSRA